MIIELQKNYLKKILNIFLFLEKVLRCPLLWKVIDNNFHRLSLNDEGSLKIKEISYVHAEGFSGGALKHGNLFYLHTFDEVLNKVGPFALLGDDTPIIFIVIDDQHQGKMRVAVEEVSV